MSPWKRSLIVDSSSLAVNVGHVLLRVSIGLMVFLIHGLHKLEGGIAYLRDGTPWPLLGDVNGMHFPAPVTSAWAATIVQLICPLFLMAGLFTRIAAGLLGCVLSGAVMQNLLAARDPQLAILYALIVISLAFMGGGRYSLDAKLTTNRYGARTGQA